jgi:hypothetical protein
MEGLLINAFCNNYFKAASIIIFEQRAYNGFVIILVSSNPLIDSPRHRYACHPSLRFAHRGDFSFSQPSLRQSRREGGQTKCRPGESALLLELFNQ